MLTPPRTRAARTLALLGSLCLFLSALEYLIPKPLPFMRIGLANLPLLAALDMLVPADFFLLVLLKVLGQGILGGTLFSYIFLFSAAGTLVSAALMYVLRRALGKERIGFAGLGCAGAMASGCVQLLLARFLVFGDVMRYAAPPFLLSCFAAGTGLGFFCERFCTHSAWYAAHTGGIVSGGAAVTVAFDGAVPVNPKALIRKREESRLRRSRLWDDFFGARALFIAGIIAAVIFLWGRSVPCRAIQFVLFCLLAILSGKKNNFFITAVFITGIIVFNLLVPYGKVLAAAGPLRITQGSLFAGIDKALVLTGLTMLSGAFVRTGLRLPGAAGLLLGETFQTLERMRRMKWRINRKNFVSGIDNILFELENEDTVTAGELPLRKTGIRGIVVLCVILALIAVPVFIFG